MSQTNEATAAQPEAAKGAGLNHRVVLQAVRRRPLALVAAAVLALGAAAAVWFFLPLPKTTAAAVFHIASQTPTLLTPSSTSESGTPFASYKLSQVSMVKSRLTLSAALRQPGVTELGVVRTAEPDAINWLDRKLVVDNKSGSEFMRVTIEGEDGDELLVLLDAISKAYLASVDDQDNGARKRRLAKLEENQRNYRAEVERYQGQIDKIAIALSSRDGPTLAALDAVHKEDLRVAAHDLATLRDQYALAERELAAWDAANARKDEGQGAVQDREIEDAVKRELQQNRTLGELEEAVNRATLEFAKAENDYVAGTAPFLRAREKLADAKAKRDKYLAEVRPAVEARLKESLRRGEQGERAIRQGKLASLGQRVKIAEERVENAKKEIARSNEHRIELENYKRLSDHNEKLFVQMTEQIERIKIDLGAPPRVTMSEPPYLVSGLEGNRRLKYTIMAGAGVFLLGFAGVVAWEFRARRVTHPDEVTVAIGLRLLGTVPPVVGGDAAQTALTRAALVEAIDTTRTMLLHATPAGPGLRTLLVTSAVAGEGKTSLSGHLAISLARAGFKTVLIDGDLQSPSVHDLFDLPVGPGFCELLRGEIDAGQAIRPTPFAGLSVLPAGVMDLSARQSLVGARWRWIRQELESQFDFLVIDTAPLLLVSDTLLLAREANGVVLSVLLGASQVGHVTQAVERLRAVGANLTGAVVNGVWQEAYHASSRYAAAAAQSAEPAAGESADTAANKG